MKNLWTVAFLWMIRAISHDKEFYKDASLIIFVISVVAGIIAYFFGFMPALTMAVVTTVVCTVLLLGFLTFAMRQDIISTAKIEQNFNQLIFCSSTCVLTLLESDVYLLVTFPKNDFYSVQLNRDETKRELMRLAVAEDSWLKKYLRKHAIELQDNHEKIISGDYQELENLELPYRHDLTQEPKSSILRVLNEI